MHRKSIQLSMTEAEDINPFAEFDLALIQERFKLSALLSLGNCTEQLMRLVAINSLIANCSGQELLRTAAIYDRFDN